MVLPALRFALAGRRRDRAVRPQLVQPRRRRARDGLLHRGRRRGILPLGAGIRAYARALRIMLINTGFPSPTKSSICASRCGSTIRSSSGSSARWIVESRSRWEQYTKAKEAMLERTHIPEAPWHLVEADDKKKARLNCIAHLLEQIPYQEIKHDRWFCRRGFATPNIAADQFRPKCIVPARY